MPEAIDVFVHRSDVWHEISDGVQGYHNVEVMVHKRAINDFIHLQILMAQEEEEAFEPLSVYRSVHLMEVGQVEHSTAVQFTSVLFVGRKNFEENLIKFV